MRFILAIIVVIINAFLMLMTSKGFADKTIMFSSMFGYVLLAPSIIAGFFCIPKKHRTNKRFFRVFNIVSILVILSAIPKFIETHASPPKTIAGKLGLIEITVPNSWRTNPPPGDNISFNLTDQQGVTTVVVNAEAVNENSDSISNHAEIILNRLSKNEAYLSTARLQNCTVNGFECVYSEVKMSFGKNGTTTLVATLKSNANFYVFFGSTNSPLYKKQDFFNILNTLKEK